MLPIDNRFLTLSFGDWSLLLIGFALVGLLALLI